VRPEQKHSFCVWNRTDSRSTDRVRSVANLRFQFLLSGDESEIEKDYPAGREEISIRRD